jgi:hypothetical protein
MVAAKLRVSSQLPDIKRQAIAATSPIVQVATSPFRLQNSFSLPSSPSRVSPQSSPTTHEIPSGTPDNLNSPQKNQRYQHRSKKFPKDARDQRFNCILTHSPIKMVRTVGLGVENRHSPFSTPSTISVGNPTEEAKASSSSPIAMALAKNRRIGKDIEKFGQDYFDRGTRVHIHRLAEPMPIHASGRKSRPSSACPTPSHSTSPSICGPTHPSSSSSLSANDKVMKSKHPARFQKRLDRLERLEVQTGRCNAICMSCVCACKSATYLTIAKLCKRNTHTAQTLSCTCTVYVVRSTCMIVCCVHYYFSKQSQVRERLRHKSIRAC